MGQRVARQQEMIVELAAGMEALAAELGEARRTSLTHRTGVAVSSDKNDKIPSYAHVTRAEAAELGKSERAFVEYLLAKAEGDTSKLEIARLLKARRLYLTAVQMTGVASQAANSVFIVKDEQCVMDDEFLVDRFTRYTSQLEMKQRILALASPKPMKTEARVYQGIAQSMSVPRRGPSETARCAICGDTDHWWKDCKEGEKKAAFIQQRERRLVGVSTVNPIIAGAAAHSSSGSTSSGGQK